MNSRLLPSVVAACLAAAIVLALPGRTFAQASSTDAPVANPGRPTVSTPATLTPVGYLQFESGVLAAGDFGDFSTRVGLNQVTKLTVHKRVQLLLQSEPLVRVGWRGRTSESVVGGFAGGVQAVVRDGTTSGPTLSVSYIQALSDGRAPDLDVGSARQSLMFLASDDLFGVHIDGNLMLNRQVDGERARAQHGQSLSVSRGWGRVVLAGEIWHFTQPALNGRTTGHLLAVSYSVRPNLVLDGGFNHGMTETSTRWEFLAGATYLLPERLWGRRQP